MTRFHDLHICDLPFLCILMFLHLCEIDQIAIFDVMSVHYNKALLQLHRREEDIMCGGSPLIDLMLTCVWCD